MKKAYELVCLFGFSSHFVELAKYCESLRISCVIVHGVRQSESIKSLDLPKSVNIICTDNLKNGFYDQIEVKTNKTLGISFGSPFIFDKYDIDNFEGNLINSHGAPLPEFKGGGGYSWRILQRDKRGCALMHLVSQKIDEGAVVFRHDFLFADNEREPGQYERRQNEEEIYQMMPWVQNIISGKHKLDNEKYKNTEKSYSTYFPRLCTDIHGYIDWSLAFEDLESFILAFSRPYMGSSTFIKGEKVRIFDIRLQRKENIHPFLKGLVLSKTEKDLNVACSDGVISIRLEDIKKKIKNPL